MQEKQRENEGGKTGWNVWNSRNVQNTRLRLVFYTSLSYSPDIPLVHYRTINARDSLSI